MNPVAAAVIHGIGVTRPGYAKPIIDGIRREFEAHLKSLKISDVSADALVFKEVLWDDVVAIRQRELAVILRKGFDAEPKSGFTAFLGAIFSGPKKMINWLRTDFAAEFVQDVLSYRDREVYSLVHHKVSQELAALPFGAAKIPLTLITHSLGTVIASDFIYDRQKKGTIDPRWTFSNFFTLGSPIALFALQYGGAEVFKSPVKVEDPSGAWVNIYDRDDPIGYPLKTLNEFYDRAVAKDLLVNTGVFGAAHTHYFENREVQQAIGAKLAEDWIRINNSLSP